MTKPLKMKSLNKYDRKNKFLKWFNLKKNKSGMKLVIHIRLKL